MQVLGLNKAELSMMMCSLDNQVYELTDTKLDDMPLSGLYETGTNRKILRNYKKDIEFEK